MSPLGTQQLLEARSAEEAREMVQAAAEAGTALRIRGHASRAWLHPIDARPDCSELRLGGLRGMRWIDAGDRTCRVQAGTSLAELDEALAEAELMLPFWDGSAGSVAGAFLGGGPSLFGAAWGMPRDQVLGARWILPDAREVRSGTRVVKSVAGYDLTRLLLGSRGRLAACTELTLRLRPRPRQWAFLQAPETTPEQRLGSCLAVRLPGGSSASQDLVLWSDPLAVPAAVRAEPLAPQELEDAVLVRLREALRPQRGWEPSGVHADEDALLRDLNQGLSVFSVARSTGWPRADSTWLPAVQAVFAGSAIPFGG